MSVYEDLIPFIGESPLEPLAVGQWRVIYFDAVSAGTSLHISLHAPRAIGVVSTAAEGCCG